MNQTIRKDSNTLYNRVNGNLKKTNHYGVILNLKTKQIETVMDIGEGIPNTNESNYHWFTMYKNKEYLSTSATSFVKII